MTETISTPDFEHQPPHIEGAPSGLQVNTLDDIVNYQREISRKFDEQSEVTDFAAFRNKEVDALLNENGIFDNDDDKAHSDYEFAKAIYRNAIFMNEDEWLTKPEDSDLQRRNLAINAIRDRYSESNPGATFSAGSEKSGTQGADIERQDATERTELTGEEKLELGESLLPEIQAKFASLVAERSKRMIEGANTRKDIEAAKEELSDMLGGLATLLMDELEAEGASWDDIPAEIDTFIAEQTDAVLAKMEAHRTEEYNNARPIMKKFYDKWAQWGEQGVKGKFKKAAAFALPGAALGAALVPLAGVVGFGAVTGALAVTGSRSVGRRLAGAHLDKRADAKKVAEAQREEIRGEIEAAENAAHTDILAIIDERSEIYRKQNLRRTAGGLAIALSVGLLTAKGADMLAGTVDNWSFGKLGELGKPDVDAPEADVAGPDLDGDGRLDALDRDRDGDGVNNGRDFAPNDPNVSEAPKTTRDQLFDGRLGTRELTPEGREALAEQLNGYKVKPGDSVWSLSEQFLAEQGVENPTVYEIDATKDVMLKELRASGNVDSQGWLSVGDKIHIK